MTNEEITREFLLLLAGYWDDPAVHRGFEELRERVSGQGEWARILDARLLALERETKEAVVLLEAILGREAEDYPASLMLARILTQDARNFRKALDVLDHLLSRGFEGEVLSEWFEAMTLAEKSYALAKEARLDEVLETADRLWDRFGGSQEPFLARQVARALLNKGFALGQQGKPEEAIRVCEEVERRFGEATEPGIREQVARALVNKGFALGQQGKPEEEIRVCEEVERRFGEATEPGIREEVARALLNKGFALGQQGKPEEAIRVCEEVERRFGEATEPGIREQVARALLNKGFALGQQGKPEEAIRVCEEVERRFGEATEPGIREEVARALLNKGFALGQQGKPEEEIRVCEEVERRFGEATEPGIREEVARALLNKGFTLGQQGKPEEAIRVCEEVERRFGEATEPGIREQVARALVNKGVTLGQQGKPEEAIRVCEEVERRFGEATEPGIREEVARALVNKGWTLGYVEKWPDAVCAYEGVVERFGQYRDQLLRKWVFEAQLRKSLALLAMERDKEARKLFESIQEELLDEGEIKKQLTSLYTVVARRFLSEMLPKDAPQRKVRMKRDLEITRDVVVANLQMMLSHVLKEIDHKTQKIYFDNMKAAQTRTDSFITEDAHFSDEFSFLLVLREWNSYTPVIPAAEESDRGGGYYIRHAGEGIVIDPGYDFIENFHRSGGRLNGIDHIVVTHAHDDHTAELEPLLMLFQRRRGKQNLPKKCVNLYLSAGVQRKFAGLLNLRDPTYGKVVTLCPSTKHYEQRLPLNGKTVLTVLPAFHDDVITRDSAVGLGFEFDTENGKRRVVFTGDSGLYPRKLSPDGDEMHYDAAGKNPMLEAIPGRALFEQYPKKFLRSPHLVVAHIGSIKEQEFGVGEIPSPADAGRWFYPNHLGLLGTLMLLNELHPDAAVVSEFGAELKGFHIDLVEKLGLALNKVQEEKKPDGRKTLVVTGDLTTAYDITHHRFLSHTQYNDDTFKFVDVDELACCKAKDFLYQPKWVEEIEVSEKKGSIRAYLFIKGDSNDTYNHTNDLNAKVYAKHFYGRALPYQKDPVTDANGWGLC